MLDKCRWLQCAQKVLAWVPKYKSASKSGNQNTVELDQTKGRWKLRELAELIGKGRSIADNDVKFQTEIDALDVMLKTGYQNEYVVRFLILAVLLT